MPLSSVLAFWAVAAVLIVVPGPDWAFAISAGLRQHAVPAAGGIVLGYLAMTAVVATGLGVLVATTPAALTALRIAGGLYLAWLGARTVRHPAAAVAGSQPGGTAGGTLLHGMAVSGLNPKGLLIFVAVMPQFADSGARWSLPVQLGVLGLAFTLTCAVVYLTVGTAAHRLLRARPSAARAVSRVSGAVMIVLGLALLLEHLAG